MSKSVAIKQCSLLKAVISLVVTVCLVGWTSFPAPAALAEPAPTETEQATDPKAIDYSNLEEGTYDPDAVIVKYHEDTTPATALNTLKDTDGVDETATKKDGQLTADALEDDLAKVQLDEGADVADTIENLNENDAVEYAQPNFIYHLLDEDASEPADESPASLAAQSTVVSDPATKNVDAKSSSAQAWHLDRIGAFDAWDRARSNNKVTVAVLDTGCRVTHNDLKDNVLTDLAWDEERDETLTKDYSAKGHGTHVAGIIAARANNEIGTAGVSYNANILPIQVFSPDPDNSSNQAASADTGTVTDAYEYLENIATKHPELNLRIANLSIGGAASPYDDRALRDAITNARAHGIISVCAAGNGKQDENGEWIPDETFTIPSDFDASFSVTALSTDKTTPTSYCSRNQYKDICAPGDRIYSTGSSTDSSYVFMNGTSMATPVVSGCFALLWAANPRLTVDEAVAIVQETADKTNFTPEAGYEDKYGAGVIDIDAAIKRAMDDSNSDSGSNSSSSSGSTAPQPAAKTSLSGATISGVTAKTYNGSARTQSGLKVTLKGKTLESGTDYTVSYSSNKYVGTARITVTGTGSYTGSASKAFAINPAGTSLRKLQAKKGAAKVTWTKRTAQTGGYQIRYSLSSSMKKAKFKTVSGAKYTSKTISKLKSKKTYCFQIRVYKKAGGKTYWSSWSAKKKIRVK